MTFEQIAKLVEERWDRRLAWFIRKYYIEQKTIDEIIVEMYINTHWWFYSMKRRALIKIKELCRE